MTNIILLSQLPIEVEYLKYFQRRTREVSELETINDRGYEYQDYVKRDVPYTVEVRSTSDYDYTEKAKKRVYIKSYLGTLNEKSKTKEINVGLKALTEYLTYLETELKKVVDSEMYSDKFKAEITATITKNEAETQTFIETLNGYKNDKGRKSELTKLRKTLREASAEVEAYIVDKWKFNEKYVTMTERKLNEKYPELKIEYTQTRFENIATIIDINGELKAKNVKGRL